jgi:hypothetical protein
MLAADYVFWPALAFIVGAGLYYAPRINTARVAMHGARTGSRHGMRRRPLRSGARWRSPFGQGARPGDRPAAVLDHRRGGASLGAARRCAQQPLKAAADSCKNDQAAGRPICARGFVRGGSHERVSGPVAATAGPEANAGSSSGHSDSSFSAPERSDHSRSDPSRPKGEYFSPERDHSPFPLPRADERETGRHG